MPELPDLEVYRENLLPLVQDKRITNVRINFPRVLQDVSKGEFVAGLQGRMIREIERRGKYLLFALPLPADKTSNFWLVVHLMMYGEMHFSEGKIEDLKGIRARLTFETKEQLIFVDGSGWMKLGLVDEEDTIGKKLQRKLDKLGVEPLSKEFDQIKFAELLKKKQLGSIKEKLMDQSLIAGIGNAYADEILWQARISPKRPASRLTDKEIVVLYTSIRKILRESIKEVRTRLSGEIKGEIRDFLHVHSRPNKKICARCGSGIERIEVAKRGTYFCPACQT